MIADRYVCMLAALTLGPTVAHLTNEIGYAMAAGLVVAGVMVHDFYLDIRQCVDESTWNTWSAFQHRHVSTPGLGLRTAVDFLLTAPPSGTRVAALDAMQVLHRSTNFPAGRSQPPDPWGDYDDEGVDGDDAQSDSGEDGEPDPAYVRWTRYSQLYWRLAGFTPTGTSAA